MAVKIGISGFGRIGRCTFRTSLAHAEVEIAAVNNRSVGPIMADLLKFDTVHGTWDHDVSFDTDKQALVIDGRYIPVTNHTDPAAIPWRQTFAGRCQKSHYYGSRKRSRQNDRHGGQ